MATDVLADPRGDWLRKAGLQAALLTLLVVGVVHATAVFGLDWGRVDGDPWNYLAAGERLNAGHHLYALETGDRPVVLRPPWWSVPLLAPPPIAVAWRLPALAGDVSMYLWGALCLAALVWAAAHIGKGGGLILIALLAEPLMLTGLSGNFSAILLAMLVIIWMQRDRPWIVGTLVAVATAVKLTPVLLVLWLIATGRMRAVAVFAGVSLVILVVALVGAGPAAFADWIRFVPSSRPSPIAISTLTGLPVLLVPMLLAIPIVLFRSRDRRSFGFAVAAMALASPALYFTAIGLLAAIPLGRARSSPETAIGQGARPVVES